MERAGGAGEDIEAVDVGDIEEIADMIPDDIAALDEDEEDE